MSQPRRKENNLESSLLLLLLFSSSLNDERQSMSLWQEKERTKSVSPKHSLKWIINNNDSWPSSPVFTGKGRKDDWTSTDDRRRREKSINRKLIFLLVFAICFFAQQCCVISEEENFFCFVHNLIPSCADEVEEKESFHFTTKRMNENKFSFRLRCLIACFYLFRLVMRLSVAGRGEMERDEVSLNSSLLVDASWSDSINSIFMLNRVVKNLSCDVAFLHVQLSSSGRAIFLLHNNNVIH